VNTPNVKFAAAACVIFLLVFGVLLFAFDAGNDEKPTVFDASVVAVSTSDCHSLPLHDGPLTYKNTEIATSATDSAMPLPPRSFSECTPTPAR